MSLTEDNRRKYCFAPCPQHVIDRGGCACHNILSKREEVQTILREVQEAKDKKSITPRPVEPDPNWIVKLFHRLF